MLDSLLDLAYGAMTSPWIYVAVLLFAAIDAFFPVVPSETLVIAAGTFAASGEPNALLVFTAGAVGAYAGDHISYRIGRATGGRLPAADGGLRRRAAWDWARRTVARRGGPVLVVARYVPGGRTATTLTMGALRYPLRSFSTWDGVAATTWAGYSTLLGYLAGSAFHDEPVKGVLLGLGLALGVTGAIETVRWARSRSSVQRSAAEADHAGSGEQREEPGEREEAHPGADVRHVRH